MLLKLLAAATAIFATLTAVSAVQVAYALQTSTRLVDALIAGEGVALCGLGGLLTASLHRIITLLEQR